MMRQRQALNQVRTAYGNIHKSMQKSESSKKGLYSSRFEQRPEWALKADDTVNLGEPELMNSE